MHKSQYHLHLLGTGNNSSACLMESWLSSLERGGKSASTIATYRREVRRLKWYCAAVADSELTAWTEADASAYVRFLREQAQNYICPPTLRFGHPDWTPFRKGNLSGEALDAAVRIARLIASHLFNTGAARRNPFAEISMLAQRRNGPTNRMAIPLDILDFVLTSMDARLRSTATNALVYWRNRFVILLYCRTGLRVSEGAQANMADIHQIEEPVTGNAFWALAVGEQDIPLDLVVMDALRSYRRAFQLPEFPSADETLGLILSPLTSSWDVTTTGQQDAGDRRLRAQWKSIRTRQTIRNIIRGEFELAASEMPNSTVEAALLLRASPQWLRHTHGAMLTAAGVDATVIAHAMRYRNERSLKSSTTVDFFDIARALDGNMREDIPLNQHGEAPDPDRSLASADDQAIVRGRKDNL